MASRAQEPEAADVYLPAKPLDAAPVILVVHGGGWANGNKDNPGLVDGKAGRWLPEGRVLVSTNYRMRPDTAPLDQARDVARALAQVQRLAPEWGADPSRVVLMGHSAGAHLAALVGASPALWREAGLSIADPASPFGFPRIAFAIEYHAPLHYDDEIEIHVDIEAVTTRTIRYRSLITRQGVRVASTTHTACCIRREPAPIQSVPIPDAIRARLKKPL